MCNQHILPRCVSKLRIRRRTLIKCILIVCDSAGNPTIICTNYWFKQCFFILATTVSGSGFSSGRWCGTVWISDDLRVYTQWYNNHNNIQWDLNESNRNIHDIYRVYVSGPVTGTLHAVSPIAGAETEPARRRWRRPASRPVLSRYCIFFGVLPFTKANPFPPHRIFALAFSDYNLLCVIDTYFHKDMNGEKVLVTIGLDSGFSFVRWCVTHSVNDDLLFVVFSVNDIPWNLNEIYRNIHDIYNMCLCLGPVTGIFHLLPEPSRNQPDAADVGLLPVRFCLGIVSSLECYLLLRPILYIYNVCLCLGPVTGISHTVSPIAGTEPEPARRCWRRPASRPVLSRYCIFFGVLPFTKANPLYLQCMSVFRASNWYITYSVTYCRNRAGTSPTLLASACFPSGSVSVLYFLWSVTFY